MRETGEAGHTIVSVFEAEARPPPPRRRQQPGGARTGAAEVDGREQIAVAELRQALLRELINYCSSSGELVAAGLGILG